MKNNTYVDVNGNKIEKIETYGPWRRPKAKWLTTVFDTKGNVLVCWQYATLKDAKAQINCLNRDF
jgi:hypothetical protein